MNQQSRGPLYDRADRASQQQINTRDRSNGRAPHDPQIKAKDSPPGRVVPADRFFFFVSRACLRLSSLLPWKGPRELASPHTAAVPHTPLTHPACARGKRGGKGTSKIAIRRHEDAPPPPARSGALFYSTVAPGRRHPSSGALAPPRPSPPSPQAHQSNRQPRDLLGLGRVARVDNLGVVQGDRLDEALLLELHEGGARQGAVDLEPLHQRRGRDELALWSWFGGCMDGCVWMRWMALTWVKPRPIESPDPHDPSTTCIYECM